MKKKYIYVFLSNKTNTFDIFFPFAKKLKNKYKELNFKFFVFNKKTYEDINNNLLFRNEVKSLGVIKVINGFFFSQFKIARIFFTLYNICKISLHSLYERTSFFYFKGIEEFPFSFLYFINKKNCYLMDSDPWGYLENINNAYNLKNNQKLGLQSKVPYKNYNKLITFSQKWNQVEYSHSKGKNVFFFNSTRAEKSWLKFCKASSEKYLKENPSFRKKLERKKVILYLFGTFSEIVTVDERYNGKKLFENTMKVLNNLKHFCIIIKPHPNANLKLLKIFIDKFKNKNIIINKMHVSVLSNFCDFTISNYMSLAMGDAWLSGATTIEYTKYKKKLLKITNYNSTIPKFADYFINIEAPEELKKILDRNHDRVLRTYKNDIPNDNEQLFLKDFKESMHL